MRQVVFSEGKKSFREGLLHTRLIASCPLFTVKTSFVASLPALHRKQPSDRDEPRQALTRHHYEFTALLCAGESVLSLQQLLNRGNDPPVAFLTENTEP